MCIRDSVGTVGFAVGAGGELAGSQPARFHHLFLCGRLYGLAQAADAAKYCHWWRRRCIPANDRLDSGDRHIVNRTIAAVCHYLYVDTAAFLGLGTGQKRRLHPGQNPDVAGGIWRC